MPRYYFHYWTGRRYEVDETGVEFPDFDAAFLDAFAAAGEISAETMRLGGNPEGMWFDIVDHCGRPLTQIPFSEALDANGQRRPGRGPSLMPMEVNASLRARLVERLRSTVATAQQRRRESEELVARSRLQKKL